MWSVTISGEELCNEFSQDLYYHIKTASSFTHPVTGNESEDYYSNWEFDAEIVSIDYETSISWTHQKEAQHFTITIQGNTHLQNFLNYSIQTFATECSGCFFIIIC